MKKTFGIVCLLGLLSFLVVACSDGVMDVKYAIFSSITECEKLQSDTLEGATFQQETDPSKDPHLKELTFEEFFAGRFYCTEFEFVIYAYKFEREN